MKSLIILLGGRLLNGVFGLFFYIILKLILEEGAYSIFSKNIAFLTFLTVFSSNVLSALFLRNAYKLGSDTDSVTILGIVFFFLISVIGVEFSLFFNLFTDVTRQIIYIYILTNIITSLSIVDLQVKQKFVMMIIVDIFRMIIPVCVFYILSLKNIILSRNDYVFAIIITGNIFGLIYFFTKISNLFTLSIKNINFIYGIKSELIFGFSFAAFSGLSQFIIAKDRDFIYANSLNTNSSSISYTADQITKILNSILFPLNTKVSSELGELYLSDNIGAFNRKIKLNTYATLVVGTLITIAIYIVFNLFFSIPIIKELNGISILFYGFGNTLFLSSIILQKKYDYCHLKILPMILLFASSLLGMCIYMLTKQSYFFITYCIYIILLVSSLNFSVFQITKFKK